MNPVHLVGKRHAALWSSVAALALSLLGCQQRVIQGEEGAMEGGSMDETSTLAFHRRDGKPAVGARVQLFGASDTGLAPRVQVIADASGGVDLPTPEKGYYNLVVRGRDGDALFQDSLYSNGTVFSVASDTLMRTGVLRGRIRVQPQHSPRIAWIHVLGAGIWSNVDDSGRFTLEGVPAGKYTVAAYTLVDGYTPTFVQVRTVSDSTVEAGDIRMVFTGLPVVQNLEARFDTLAGKVYLRWDSLPLRETWRYNLYRNDTLQWVTTSPRWVDDVSQQYPATVPAEGRNTYRVTVADAGEVGPKWESITMRVISAFLYQEIKIDWEKRSDLPWQSDHYRMDTVGSELVSWVSLQSGLLEAGAVRWVQKWVSPDSGVNWKMELDSLPLLALPFRFKDHWWSVYSHQVDFSGGVRKGDIESQTTSNGKLIPIDSVVVATSSNGGLSWNSVGAFAPKELITNWRFEPNPDGIFLIGGCSVWASDSCKVSAGWYSDKRLYQIRNLNPQFGEGNYPTVWSPDMPLLPSFYGGVGSRKAFWEDSVYWDLDMSGLLYAINGKRVKEGFGLGIGGNDYREFANGLFVFREQGRIVLFGSGKGVSTDTAIGNLHAIQLPSPETYKPFFMMRYRNGFLYASPHGIYFGRITRNPLGDPRGTWLKKTEVPSVF